MYIVNPSFEEQQLNKIIETLNQEFEKNKVKVINHYVWGKKRLAYPIPHLCPLRGPYVKLMCEGN